MFFNLFFSFVADVVMYLVLLRDLLTALGTWVQGFVGLRQSWNGFNKWR